MGAKKWLAKQLFKKKPKSEVDEIADLLDNDRDANYGITDYTRGQNMRINRLLREGKEPTSDAWNQLQKMFKRKGNYAGQSHRGTQLNTEKLKGLKEGDLIENQSVLSSSANPTVARMFNAEQPQAKHISTDIRIDNTKKPQYNIENYSVFPDEREVLVAPKNISRVRRKEEVHGNMELDLEVLSDLDVSKLSKEQYNQVFKNLMGAGGVSAIGAGSSQDKE